MESQFGRGFIINITMIAKHFSLPPEQAWPGVKDHLTEMQVPEQFLGTEVEELVTMLRKKIMWHQIGTMDKEEAELVIRVLRRLLVAIDRNLGIPDPHVGKYD